MGRLQGLGRVGWVDSEESEGFERRDLPLSKAGGGSEVQGTHTFGSQAPLSFNVRYDAVEPGRQKLPQ